MAQQYTQEFRDDAVELVRESSKSLREVASDLGVNAWTLRGWVKKERETRRPMTQGKTETLEEENRRLRRENSVLKQEHEFLRKAAAYFAKEQR